MATVKESVSWTDFTPPPKGGSGESNIKFLKASDCPIRLVPVGRLIGWSEIFDEQLKHSRDPRPGEKAKRRFAFEAADQNGVVSVYVVGAQVATSVANIVKTAMAYGAKYAAVKIVASGSGKETVYTAEPDVQLGQLAMKEGWIKRPDNLPSLEQTRDVCLGRVKADAPAPQKDAGTNDQPAW